ncbi:MAG TPA: CocE/NonD family hydrolase [bacterium]|nr:CocE/NonD family hydrolase [bacterium]
MSKITVQVLIIGMFLQLGAVVKQTVMVPMEDGTELETDIYLPDDWEGKSYPVLLNRSPYDRDQKAQIGTDLTANNVVFVAQSFRGTFGSGGTHGVFHSEGWGEMHDGYDTLKWITDQSWCNGKIATIGGSAEGLAQYLMAGLDEKPGLVYQIITVASGDLYDGTFFPGGMFREHAMTAWLEGQDASFFLDTLKTDDMYSMTNDYWDVTNLYTVPENIAVPAAHVGGWFDMFNRHQVDTFNLYQASGAPDQHLVMGPWSHGTMMSNVSNEMTFPENAEKYYEGDTDPAFALLVHFYYPLNIAKPDWAPVTYYTIGDIKDDNAPGNVWKTSDTFPPVETVPQRLSAGTDLILKAGECGSGDLNLKFDYADPFPTLCGNNLTINPGPCDVSQYRKRSDAISFQTEPFETPTEITGAVDVTVSFTTGLKDFDLVAVLTDIYPDGTEYLIIEGGKKVRFRDGFDNEKLLTSGEKTVMTFNAGYISIIFNKGHRMGFHLSTAYWPKYRLPSTVADYWDDTPVKGEVVFDLSGTFIDAGLIGQWGGEKCAVSEEEPDGEDVTDTDSVDFENDHDSETEDVEIEDNEMITGKKDSGGSMVFI